MKNQTLLARGFVEFVVITVGVLVALAIDNAWSARQDRIDERAYLSAVLEEIEGNAANMVLTLRAAAAAAAGAQTSDPKRLPFEAKKQKQQPSLQ